MGGILEWQGIHESKPAKAKTSLRITLRLCMYLSVSQNTSYRRPGLFWMLFGFFSSTQKLTCSLITFWVFKIWEYTIALIFHIAHINQSITYHTAPWNVGVQNSPDLEELNLPALPSFSQ